MTSTAMPSLSFLTVGEPDIALVAVPSELTVPQAAALLDVKEGYITELFDDNLIQYRKEGNRYFIDRNSLLEYKERWERRHANCDELLNMFREIGLSDD
jgi:excisionase family DNA binding protein